MKQDEMEEYENYHGRLQDLEGADDMFEDTEDSEHDQRFFEDFDNSINDIDFSEIRGKDFKKSFSKVNRKIDGKRKAKSQKPLSKKFAVEQKADIVAKGQKKIANIIVPDDKKVIVQGVNQFILSQNPKDDAIRNIGYYKGKKLKQLVLTFNNNSAIDFQLELFNPSMPLDYLFSTSMNLNDKIQVAGGVVSYTDVLFNLLANPALLVNAKFVFAGASMTQQMSIPLSVQNKQITGEEKIQPLNLNLQLDNMQVQGDMVFFDIMQTLNRPFIPDGMDVMGYTVKAGMTVTMAFFYKQISLKKVFYEEARKSKTLM